MHEFTCGHELGVWKQVRFNRNYSRFTNAGSSLDSEKKMSRYFEMAAWLMASTLPPSALPFDRWTGATPGASGAANPPEPSTSPTGGFSEPWLSNEWAEGAPYRSLTRECASSQFLVDFFMCYLPSAFKNPRLCYHGPHLLNSGPMQSGGSWTPRVGLFPPKLVFLSSRPRQLPAAHIGVNSSEWGYLLCWQSNVLVRNSR